MLLAAETLQYSVGHEFGHQALVLIPQLPLSSICVVSELVQVTH